MAVTANNPKSVSELTLFLSVVPYLTNSRNLESG